MADRNHNQKTIREAERDVEAARANLAGSINDFEARLSPNALVDQGIAYFRGDGRRHIDSVMRSAQTNPIPLVLIGIGVAWLALGSRRTLSESRTADQRVPNDSVYGRDRYGYDREGYGQPSRNTDPTVSDTGVGASATTASSMTGQPRTAGLEMDTQTPLSDKTLDPLSSSKHAEETVSAIPADPLLKDDIDKTPGTTSKPPVTSGTNDHKDTTSFRDPIATAHSVHEKDKSTSDDDSLGMKK